MKLLYLCGAISSNPNYKKDFEKAYNKLHQAGYEILNPVEFCKGLKTWEDCMRKCLFTLTTLKDLGIVKIETPYQSKGAELEMQIAQALGYEIKSADEWVKTWNK